MTCSTTKAGSARRDPGGPSGVCAARARDAEAAALAGTLLDARRGRADGVRLRAGRVRARFPRAARRPGRVAVSRVLLPVARHDTAEGPQPLRWGEYRRATLVEAPFGLREPAAAVAAARGARRCAATVLVPALAVDRRGVRLGRGAGFYDRSLRLADPARRGWSRSSATTSSSTSCPPSRTTSPMTHALTPRRGLVALGRADGSGMTRRHVAVLALEPVEC